MHGYFVFFNWYVLYFLEFSEPNPKLYESRLENFNIFFSNLYTLLKSVIDSNSESSTLISLISTRPVFSSGIRGPKNTSSESKNATTVPDFQARLSEPRSSLNANLTSCS